MSKSEPQSGEGCEADLLRIVWLNCNMFIKE